MKKEVVIARDETESVLSNFFGAFRTVYRFSCSDWAMSELVLSEIILEIFRNSDVDVLKLKMKLEQHSINYILEYAGKPFSPMGSDGVLVVHNSQMRSKMLRHYMSQCEYSFCEGMNVLSLVHTDTKKTKTEESQKPE